MSDHAACQQRIDALEGALEAAERVNRELQQAMAELERAAGTDRLTGTWNRRRFEEGAAILMSLARRGKGQVSLLLFDLDHFKQVNDLYGHAVGDTVLAETVHSVREHLRESDALVRWGGEEFIVLTPATRLEGALSLAEKVRQAVAAHAFPRIGHMTVSIGVAEFTNGMDLEAWIHSADEAMYRAKAEGRNRVVAAHDQESAEGKPSLLEIVWEDAYCCGEPTIDAQHQRLFALANGLFGATTSHQPQGEVTLRLRKLAAHAAQHFRDEEVILQQVGYAEAAGHARTHDTLLKRMIDLQDESEKGALDTVKLVEFLIVEMVQGHLLAEDTKFFHCFR
jgi:diguanylate cyclase (GGDEF)-like protein/hemerythrin-like metal-binding protein